MAGPDYILDIAGLRDAVGSQTQVSQVSQVSQARPWLAVHWRCCSVYSRVYRNAQATAYDARCPRCGKAVRVRVGTGGTSCRFFEAG